MLFFKIMYYICHGISYHEQKNSMKKVIGFATQFYTLWDYEAVPTYRTDAYGNHHCTGVNHKYYYIKNISTDLERVKQLYPNVAIDDQLRGAVRSFDMYKQQELPENYFWGGKYAGKLVDEILISDFNYCLWAIENYTNKTAAYIKAHPIYMQYLADKKKAEDSLVQEHDLLIVGDEKELLFNTNGYNPFWSNNGQKEYVYSTDEEWEANGYDRCYASATYGDVDIEVLCSGVRQVSGMYPYLMPIISGKAQKTRGKSVKVKVLQVLSVRVYNGRITQTILIA